MLYSKVPWHLLLVFWTLLRKHIKFFSNTSITSIEIIRFFIINHLNMMHYTDSSSKIILTLNFWNKSNLVIMYLCVLLKYHFGLSSNISLRIFASVCMMDCLCFSVFLLKSAFANSLFRQWRREEVRFTPLPFLIPSFILPFLNNSVLKDLRQKASTLVKGGWLNLVSKESHLQSRNQERSIRL